MKQMKSGLESDRDGFFDRFTTQYFCVDGAPHGCNVSHVGESDQALLDCLAR